MGEVLPAVFTGRCRGRAVLQSPGFDAQSACSGGSDWGADFRDSTTEVGSNAPGT